MSLKKKGTWKRSPNFAIFDTGSAKHIDVLQVSLLRAGKHTLLPELYDIFGKDKLLKFLDIFAGTTIEVPSKKVLESAIRDTYIYLSLENIRKGGGNRKKSDVVKDLADRYSIESSEVLRIYADMKGYF